MATLHEDSPTALELGLEVANDSFARLAPELRRIPSIGRSETPTDWLPWVLEDRGLAAIVPYVRDMPKALREGPFWLKKRGTDPAIEIGIGWVESAGTVAPADGRHLWYKFQVAYPDPPADLHQVRQLEGIIGLSKSSWDELFRLYSPARDHRPVRMDHHRADEGLMDGYSGERLDGIASLVSFGWGGSPELDAAPVVDAQISIEAGAVVSLTDGLRLDLGRFGERPGVVTEADLETDAAFVVADNKPDSWPNVWPRGSWAAGSDHAPIAAPLEIS